jgi:hypothetical protein
MSGARRFVETAAAARGDGGNSHHGRRYSGSPPPAQGLRRTWSGGAYSIGGIVRIQAISASISLSFQFL